MTREQQSGKAQDNRKRVAGKKAVKAVRGLIRPAPDYDLLETANQLDEMASELRDDGLLMAANHCSEASEDIREHLWHLDDLAKERPR